MRGRGFYSQQWTDADYIERVKAKCTVDERGCWVYNGWKNRWGYGEISYRAETFTVHRLMYKLAVGPLPKYDGKKQDAIVCHRCDNPACCNPEHLFLGSQTDNMKDARDKKRWAKQRKTHCKHGHELKPETTYVSTNSRGHRMRHCNTCQLIRNRIRGGWTREQAESMPVTPPGQRPVNGSFKRLRSRSARASNAEG